MCVCVVQPAGSSARARSRNPGLAAVAAPPVVGDGLFWKFHLFGICNDGCMHRLVETSTKREGTRVQRKTGNPPPFPPSPSLVPTQSRVGKLQEVDCPGDRSPCSANETGQAKSAAACTVCSVQVQTVACCKCEAMCALAVENQGVVHVPDILKLLRSKCLS